MSSRLGQTISRYNAALSHNQDGQQGHNQPDPFPGGGAPLCESSHATVHAIAHQPPPSHYKGHRGHRRGHSYGGVVSPPSSGIHHSQLEARPSHPNTHHGSVVSPLYLSLLASFILLGIDFLALPNLMNKISCRII